MQFVLQSRMNEASEMQVSGVKTQNVLNEIVDFVSKQHISFSEKNDEKRIFNGFLK